MECYLAFYLMTFLFAFPNTPAAATLDEAFSDGSRSSLLRFDAYRDSCPQAESIIFNGVVKAVSREARMAASLLRLHFHDCLVNGCDASVLLDDREGFVGEKSAAANVNSLRGFNVLDEIKTQVESVCPETVSCADILAIVARDSVYVSGGPRWKVQTGRRDSLSANRTLPDVNIPRPNASVSIALAKFRNAGLTLNEMLALIGAHTIGKARCAMFGPRLKSETNSSFPPMDGDYFVSLQKLCSKANPNKTLANFDPVSPITFDNQYYVDVLSGRGLLAADQFLAEDDRTRERVQFYANHKEAFFQDFKTSMLRLGNVNPLTGKKGEIRRNCRRANRS